LRLPRFSNPRAAARVALFVRYATTLTDLDVSVDYNLEPYNELEPAEKQSSLHPDALHRNRLQGGIA
jgi:hypothetical protein